MVQKEVRKKTKIYGTVAVLSAIVLVTMVYALGSAPIIFSPSQTPLVTGMKTFSSIDELKSFLAANLQGGSSNGGGPLDSKFFGDTTPMPAPVAQTGSFNAMESAPTDSQDYSTTNIQVTGVDEADTVKTDGQYIYAASTTQNNIYYYSSYSSQTVNSVYILNADPQNAKVVSKITLGNDTQPAGLFLSQDGNKLVILASKYQTYSFGADRADTMMPMLRSYYSDVYTFINVYDVSNKANPILTRNFTVSGSYFNSRMIGNYVYAVTSQDAYVYNDVVPVPAVYSEGKAYGSSPTSIYYADMNQSSYYSFTSFYGIDVADDQQQPRNITVLMSGASTMYVSPENIYVAYPNWVDGSDITSIYRVKIDGLKLTFEAQGGVPGNTINQYAMDEYNGNLRIATNLWQNTGGSVVFGGQNSQINNVYVLNQNLSIVGKLEGLAQGENLHSVRFIGDKGYLVTSSELTPYSSSTLANPQIPKF